MARWIQHSSWTVKWTEQTIHRWTMGRGTLQAECVVASTPTHPQCLRRSNHAVIPTHVVSSHLCPLQKGVKIYDLGVLSGPHTIRLSPQTGSLVIDYLLYTPVGKTELDGKQLAYDNTNPAFNYSGAWTPREQFDTTSLPFNNTLATTSQKGSSFAIDFVGTCSIHLGCA